MRALRGHRPLVLAAALTLVVIPILYYVAYRNRLGAITGEPASQSPISQGA